MSTGSVEIVLPDPAATAECAAQLASAWQAIGSPPAVVELHGDLGAGKSELVRGFLRALGHDGAVPSPTYALVVPYEVTGRKILHLDLYRLDGADEFHDLGLDEEWASSLAFVEWPERAAGGFGAVSLAARLSISENGGRRFRLESLDETGEKWVRNFGQ